jgi:hypothetical protein
MVPFKFVLSFSRINIWDLGMRLGKFLLGSCNPNKVYSDEFPTVKFKIFFGNTYAFGWDFFI